MTDDGVGMADDREELISAYLDDELPMRERLELEDQLAHDAELAAVADEVRRTRELVRSLPERDVPAGFIETAVAAVRRSEAAEAKASALVAAPAMEEPRRTRRRRLLGAGVGFAAFGAVAIAFVLPTADDSTPDVPQLADAHVAEARAVDPVFTLAEMAVPLGLER